MKTVLCLVACFFSAAFGAGLPSSVAGTWKVERAIPTTNIQTVPDSKRIGLILSFAPDKADLAGTVVESPEYVVRTIQGPDFVADFRAPLAELGYRTDKVTAISVVKDGKAVSGFGATIFVGWRRLIAVWDGVFYELRRDSGR